MNLNDQAINFLKIVFIFINILCLVRFLFSTLLCSLWDFSSQPGIEPRPSAVRTQRPSHWTTRKSPCYQTYLRSSFYVLSKLLLFSHWVVSLWPHGLQHTSLSCPYYFPEFAQTHVHQVDDAIQPSHPLLPLLLPSIFPSIRGFSTESRLGIRWPKH